MRSPLLAVFAHPDDETLCGGGTLARADAGGARVSPVGLTWVAPPIVRVSSTVQTCGKLRRPQQGRSLGGFAGRKRRALCARPLQTGPPSPLGTLTEARRVPRPEAEPSGPDGTRPPVPAGALS